MWVHEIWRYPVKSMAGEFLDSADLTEEGIAGDRTLQVRSSDGHIVTARTRPALLGHRATSGPDGEPRVDGQPWRSGDVALLVEAAAGRGARLVESEPEDRFDILPLLVATDGMLAMLGYDRRRFLPNLVVADVAGLTERQWEGGALRISEAVIGIEDLRTRCIMTTYDPDTLKQDLNVLRRVQKEFAGRLGLNYLCHRSRGHQSWRLSGVRSAEINRICWCLHRGGSGKLMVPPSGITRLVVGRKPILMH